MDNRMIITAQIVTADGKVQSEHKLSEEIIKAPEDISQLGMGKDSQLELVAQGQQVFLEGQAAVINSCPYPHCPTCGKKIWRNGSNSSLFHGFYSDHQLKLSKWACSSASCS